MTPRYRQKQGRHGVMYQYRLTEKATNDGTPPAMLVHHVWAYNQSHADEKLRGLNPDESLDIDSIERVIDRS